MRRIMHGLSEVAGQNYYAVKGLKAIGIEAYGVVWMPHIFGYPFDIALNIDKTKKWLWPWYAIKLGMFFVYALWKFDIYHFHFGRSILFNTELWLYDVLGKNYVYEYHGSDLRDLEKFYKISKMVPCKQYRQSLKTRKQNKIICRHAKTIILHDDELIPYLPETHGIIQVIPLRIDPELFIPQYPSVNTVSKIRIVHAPSNRKGKGTEHIIRAVRDLQIKYSHIELILVEGKTQEEAKKIYASADIIVDQLYCGTYGVFALESMALGKPVISFISPEMAGRLPQELPIISADIDSLGDALEKLILDGELRRELGIDGRKYVENYHDYRNIAYVLQKVYEGQLSPAQGRMAFDRIRKIKESRDA